MKTGNNIKTKPVICTVLLFMLSIAFAGEVMATHFRGGSISWTRVAGSPNTVEITIRNAWRTLGIGGRTFDLGDGTLVTSQPADEIASLTDTAGETYKFYQTTVTHTYSGPGPWNIELSACCRISSLINSGDSDYLLTGIVDLNDPAETGSPKVSFPFILQINQGPNDITLAAVDPDGTPSCRMANSIESEIFMLATAGAETISVTEDCHLVWNASAAALGNKYAVQVILTEGDVEVPLDFIIEVADINETPQCSLSGDIVNNLTAGEAFSISVTATDPDGDKLTLNHLGLPVGATLTPVTGTKQNSPFTATFDWIPPAAGTESVTLVFTDTSGKACQSSFSINIAPNQPPECILDGAADNNLIVGIPFSIGVTATDPEEGDLTLSHLGTLPTGATLTPISGTTQASSFNATFDWTPTGTGTETVTLVFTDALGHSCQSSFTTTTQPNLPPQCDGPTTVTHILGVDGPISISVTATDSEGGDLTLTSLAPLPSGATLTPVLGSTQTSTFNAMFDWTPTVAGIETITLEFSDPLGQTCQHTITVDTKVNLPPQCSFSGTLPPNAIVGVPLSIEMVGADQEGDDLTLTHLGLPSGATLTPASGTTQGAPFNATFDWTPTTVGSETVTFVFTDSFGRSCQSSYTTTVQPNLPPQCILDGATTHNILVDDPFSIITTATDPEGRILTLTGTGVPSGATLTPVLGPTDGSAYIATFAWTPTVPGTEMIKLEFKDDRDHICESTFTINILPLMTPAPPTPPDYYNKGPDSPFTATTDLSSAEKTAMALMEAALQIAESVVHATNCEDSSGQANITVGTDGVVGSQFNNLTVSSLGGVYNLEATPKAPIAGRGQKIPVDLVGGFGQFMGTWMTQYEGTFRFNQAMNMMLGRSANITVFGLSGHDDHYKLDVIKDFFRGAQFATTPTGGVNSEYYVIYDWGLQVVHKEKFPVNKYWQRSKTTRSNNALGHTVFVKDRLVGASPCRIVINTYGDNNASIFNQSGLLTISSEIPDTAVTGSDPLGDIIPLF